MDLFLGVPDRTVVVRRDDGNQHRRNQSVLGVAIGL
jgi:hypothetical protein